MKNRSSKPIWNKMLEIFDVGDLTIYSSSVQQPRCHDKVLLMQGGQGMPNIGLLHLSSYLRRNGIKAYLMTYGHIDEKKDAEDIKNTIYNLKPTLVGISYKWYMEIMRSLWIAELIKNIDKDIITVFGGNSASYYHKELMRFPFIDYIVRGDGELPLLEICQGKSRPTNTVIRSSNSITVQPIKYIQKNTFHEEVFISNIEEQCVSKKDLACIFPIIITGKGCITSCVYCSGGSTGQRVIFGRDLPYIRKIDHIRNDIQQLMPWSPSIFFHFSPHYSRENKNSLYKWFKKCLEGLDCSNHVLFLTNWELPNDDVLNFLSDRFESIVFVLDVGALSDRHRLELVKKGCLKPTLKNLHNTHLINWIEKTSRIKNLTTMVAAVGSLPFLKHEDFKEEFRFVQQVFESQNTGMYFDTPRLHFEPCSPVVVNPNHFGMKSDINSFRDILKWFKSRTSDVDSQPELRFTDDKFDKEVEKHTNKLMEFAKKRNMERMLYLPFDPSSVHSSNVLKLQLKKKPNVLFSCSTNKWLGYRKLNIGTNNDMLNHQTITKNWLGNFWEINSSSFIGDSKCSSPEPFKLDASQIGIDILHMFNEQVAVENAWDKVSKNHNLSLDQFSNFIIQAIQQKVLN